MSVRNVAKGIERIALDWLTVLFRSSNPSQEGSHRVGGISSRDARWWCFMVIGIQFMMVMSIVVILVKYSSIGLWISPRVHGCADADNIAQKAFPQLDCFPPIDVVYTWVNGSDPIWKAKREKYKAALLSSNETDDDEDALEENDLNRNRTTMKQLEILKNELKKLDAEIKRLHESTGDQWLKEMDEVIDSHVDSVTNKYNRYKDIIEDNEEEEEEEEKGNRQRRLLEYDDDWYDNKNINNKKKRGILGDDDYLMDHTDYFKGYEDKFDFGDEVEEEEEIMFEDGDPEDTEKATQNDGGLNHDVDAEYRYRDNSELRYSLRSIEKYAPWVRHIYIVTDNQVPSWLDLSHPRVSIVPHTDIFPFKEDLPTFSSPAIESNLQNIPGLTEKFIYFNDDVLLGAPVWPEDFYSPVYGQKIFLSWGLPQCSEGCVATWLGDGYCDEACKNAECQWDYGDCDPTKTSQEEEKDRHESDGDLSFDENGKSKKGKSSTMRFPACRLGCNVRYLTDGFCDRECNYPECGYDGGDCLRKTPSTRKMPFLYFDHLKDLLGLPSKGSNVIQLPIGIRGVGVNLTSVLAEQNLTVVDAYHEDPGIVLKASFSETNKVLSIVFGNPGSFEREHELWGGAKFVYNSSDVSFNCSQDRFLSGCDGDYGCEFFSSAEHAEAACVARGSRCGGYTISNRFESDLTTYSLRVGTKPQPSKTYETACVKQVRKGASLRSIAEEPPLEVRLVVKLSNETELSFSLTAGEESERKTHDIPHSRRRRMTISQGNDESVFTKQRRLKEKFLRVHNEFVELARKEFEPPSTAQRDLLDGFGQSLLHVDYLFHQKFGRMERKVIAHMPHFIDVKHLNKLHEAFPEEFRKTSSNHFRSPDDMQYAFSYMYWVVHQGQAPALSLEEYFHRELDTDHDGIISVNELRTLASMTVGSEISDVNEVSEMVLKMIDCLHGKTEKNDEEKEGEEEQEVEEEKKDASYYRFTVQQIANCSLTRNAIVDKQPRKHTVQLVHDTDLPLAFEMLGDDFGKTLEKLDSIRARHPKFICINDNMKEPTIKHQYVIHEFFEALLPLPSQFEIPINKRNRFLYYDEYLEHVKTFRFYKSLLVFTMIIAIPVILYYPSPSPTPAQSTQDSDPQHEELENPEPQPNHRRRLHSE